jgi:hypothetical protein
MDFDLNNELNQLNDPETVLNPTFKLLKDPTDILIHDEFIQIKSLAK